MGTEDKVTKVNNVLPSWSAEHKSKLRVRFHRSRPAALVQLNTAWYSRTNGYSTIPPIRGGDRIGEIAVVVDLDIHSIPQARKSAGRGSAVISRHESGSDGVSATTSVRAVSAQSRPFRWSFVHFISFSFFSLFIHYRPQCSSRCHATSLGRFSHHSLISPHSSNLGGIGESAVCTPLFFSACCEPVTDWLDGWRQPTTPSGDST